MECLLSVKGHGKQWNNGGTVGLYSARAGARMIGNDDLDL